MKSHPILFSAPMVLALLSGRKTVTRRLSPRWDKCQVGDRLWVREVWAASYSRGCWGTLFRADHEFVQGKRKHEKPPYFEATLPPDQIKWRPSLFLPLWASRIELDLTEPVRVEPVQAITEADALAEGVEGYHDPTDVPPCADDTAREVYAALWDRINPSAPWPSNPVVRVLTFRRVVP